MRFWTKSLMARLVSYFLALTAIGVIVTSLISLGLARTALTQSVYGRLGAVAALKEDELNRWVTDQRNEILITSRETGIINSLKALSTFDEQSNDYKTAHDYLLA